MMKHRPKQVKMNIFNYYLIIEISLFLLKFLKSIIVLEKLRTNEDNLGNEIEEIFNDNDERTILSNESLLLTNDKLNETRRTKTEALDNYSSNTINNLKTNVNCFKLFRLDELRSILVTCLLISLIQQLSGCFYVN